MSFELLYTSAPAGLKPGTRGFTTVQCTDGIPSNVALRLETLSGYRHLFPPSDPRASENPVCYSHLRVPIAGKPTSVVSRIADYGADYSGRTNKIAHHVVLESSELTEAGPGWLIRQKNFLRDAWDGTTRLLPAGPVIPSGSLALRVCESWKAITGDAGWGGYLADAIEGSSGKPVWIVFRIDQSSYLPLLIEEALALLPPQDRWQTTFSTYYTNLPPEVECRIRCVVAGSEEAKLAPTRGVVIDISRPLPILASTPSVEAARTGIAVANIPPVQRSAQSTATGRGSSNPLVEANEGESLWPDDEIRLAPPTVRASQGGPPAIKSAKGSGPPKVKLPPQVDEKRGVSALLVANGAFIAGLLLLLTVAAVAIPIAYQYSKSIQQLASPGAFSRGAAEKGHDLHVEQKAQSNSADSQNIREKNDQINVGQKANGLGEIDPIVPTPDAGVKPPENEKEIVPTKEAKNEVENRGDKLKNEPAKPGIQESQEIKKEIPTLPNRKPIDSSSTDNTTHNKLRFFLQLKEVDWFGNSATKEFDETNKIEFEQSRQTIPQRYEWNAPESSEAVDIINLSNAKDSNSNRVENDEITLLSNFAKLNLIFRKGTKSVEGRLKVLDSRLFKKSFEIVETASNTYVGAIDEVVKSGLKQAQIPQDMMKTFERFAFLSPKKAADLTSKVSQQPGLPEDRINAVLDSVRIKLDAVIEKISEVPGVRKVSAGELKLMYENPESKGNLTFKDEAGMILDFEIEILPVKN